MGWLWSSTPSSGSASSASEAQTNSVPPPTPSQSRTRDDDVDPEIAKFIRQVQVEFGSNKDNNSKTPEPPKNEPSTSQPVAPAKPTPPSSSSSSSSSSSWRIWGSSAPKQPDTSNTHPESTQKDIQQQQQDYQPPDRLDPISESLLPTTMSCRQAFDTAFHCNSLGGQWTSVYRAGTVRSCSEHWDNFWFCMRTRAYSGEMKEEAIRDYYRSRELAKYYGPDKPKSTDVWEARTEKIEPGAAFAKKYVQPEISDEEWWQMEIEHRRKVQDDLAKKDAARAAGKS